MAPDQNKRAKRVPLTSEEVASVIAFKKKREQVKLQKLKSSLSYKLLNVFNTLCFFIFCELIFCYFGPCKYEDHVATSVMGVIGDVRGDGTPVIAEVEIVSEKGKKYKFIVNDFIKTPQVSSTFEVGRDFLLAKELKGFFGGSEKAYRIFAASPILLLCILTSVITLIGIGYNLNENEYSLSGLSIVNVMTLLCVVFI